MKLALAAAVLLLAVLVALLVVVTQPMAGRSSRWPGPTADPERLHASVRSLSALAPRNDEAGMARTARWIVAQLAALGLEAAPLDYQFADGKYRNLIVRLGPDTAQRVVIGAHYDARGPYPGADDNGSGTAGLLELARLLHARPPPIRAELVFYPREETDGMGSEVHALSLDPELVRAMVSLEMIGCFSGRQKFPFRALRLLYPGEGDYAVVVGRPQDFSWVRALKRGLASTGVGVQSINAPEAVRGVGNSDHRNYWRQGMTAAMITDTAWYRNPRYHSAADTPETLDYARMALVVEGVAAALSSIPR